MATRKLQPRDLTHIAGSGKAKASQFDWGIVMASNSARIYLPNEVETCLYLTASTHNGVCWEKAFYPMEEGVTLYPTGVMLIGSLNLKGNVAKFSKGKDQYFLCSNDCKNHTLPEGFEKLAVLQTASINYIQISKK